jgi:hypothetical protein
MMNKRNSVVLPIVLLLSIAFSFAQDEPPQQPKAAPTQKVLSDAILNRLSSAYRDEAKQVVTAPEETQQRCQKLSDEDLTAAIISQLGRKQEVAGFLLAQLEKEPSAKLRGRLL